MPKATPQDLTDIGFAAQQFGGPADFGVESAGGFLYDILLAVGLEVRARAGATIYDAATSDAAEDSDQLNFYRLRDAEKYLAAAVLWQRRIARLDADTMIGRSADGKADLLREYRLNRANYLTDADMKLAEVTGTTRTGGASMTVVESGPYPPVL